MADESLIPPAVPLTPFCGDLRSKKYFVLQAPATDSEQYLDLSGYCWCYHTQHSIGPDGGDAHPLDCVPGRSCYRSALAEPT